MRFQRECFALGATVAVFASVGAATAADADLRFKLAVGQECRYSVTSDAGDSTLVVGSPQGFDRKGSLSMEVLLRLVSSDSTGSTIECVVQSLKSKAEWPRLEEFDSATTPADQDSGNTLAQAYRPLVGQTLRLQVDSTGIITSVVPTQALPPTGGPAGQYRTQFLDKDVVQSRLGPILSTGNSSEKVAVGSMWATPDKVRVGPESFDVVYRHTLKATEGDNGIIESTGEFAPIMDGARQARIKSREGALTRKVTWDMKAGLLRDLESNQEVSVEMGNETQVIKITGRRKITIKRLD